MKVAIGAVDALAARTLQHTPNCDAIWLSSFEIACSLGIPDTDQLDFDTLLNRVTAITRATDKPLLLDLANAATIDLERLHILLDAIPQAVTIAIDDTRYPRVNSFSSRSNSIISPTAMRQRLENIESSLKVHPSVDLCFRTEHYFIHDDISATVTYIDYILRNVDLGLDLIFIHGYNVINNTLDVFRENFPRQRFLTMSTTSPGAFVGDFERVGADVLVIPNILTLQRYFAGPALVRAILTQELPIDGPYRPFKEVVEEIQFPSDTDSDRELPHSSTHTEPRRPAAHRLLGRCP